MIDFHILVYYHILASGGQTFVCVWGGGTVFKEKQKYKL